MGRNAGKTKGWDTLDNCFFTCSITKSGWLPSSKWAVTLGLLEVNCSSINIMSSAVAKRGVLVSIIPVFLHFSQVFGSEQPHLNCFMSIECPVQQTPASLKTYRARSMCHWIILDLTIPLPWHFLQFSSNRGMPMLGEQSSQLYKPNNCCLALSSWYSFSKQRW